MFVAKPELFHESVSVWVYRQPPVDLCEETLSNRMINSIKKVVSLYTGEYWAVLEGAAKHERTSPEQRAPVSQSEISVCLSEFPN